jgi:hypothetical protein
MVSTPPQSATKATSPMRLSDDQMARLYMRDRLGAGVLTCRTI